MASIAFAIRFRMTCCNCTRSPKTCIRLRFQLASERNPLVLQLILHEPKDFLNQLVYVDWSFFLAILFEH